MTAQELFERLALEEWQFSGVDLSGADLSGANLSNAMFYEVNFAATNLNHPRTS
ncbi:MAG: pentapeptide repeat-containing protein [Aphanocapsa sp. GSE-SYN-MK-11-07L]|nr:pentapeptide repeat-containing protein [Aphanocapsa sp. GSE-SYN-MK-11-07L]